MPKPNTRGSLIGLNTTLPCNGSPETGGVPSCIWGSVADTWIRSFLVTAISKPILVAIRFYRHGVMRSRSGPTVPF